MCSGRDPGGIDDGIGSIGAAADDIRAANRLLEGCCDSSSRIFEGDLIGLAPVA